MINEVDSPFSMDELLDRWSNLRNDFLYAESTNHPVIAPMIQDIAKARAEAKQIIREANDDFHAATKRAGVTRAGVATPAGSVWLKRDNAILNARRQNKRSIWLSGMPLNSGFCHRGCRSTGPQCHRRFP